MDLSTSSEDEIEIEQAGEVVSVKARASNFAREVEVPDRGGSDTAFEDDFSDSGNSKHARASDVES